MKDISYYQTATENEYPSNAVIKKLRADLFSIMLTFVGTKLQIEEKEASLELEQKNKVRALRDNYNAELKKLKSEFKSDIEDEHGTSNNPKKDLLFEKAWSMGHSSGYNEVYHYYSDLVDLIE